MRKAIVVAAIAAVIGAVFVLPAAGATPTPTFDRGLPTANLNNAAGSSRSNVAWSNGNNYVSGDDFTIGQSGQTWIVTGIRTWSVSGDVGSKIGDTFSSVTLYLGSGGIRPVATGNLTAGSNADSNPNITHTPVTYSDESDYQGSSGAFRQLWQNDFSNLNYTVNGGEKYDFAVDGSLQVPNSYYWFNHASNAALSGSTQQGADGKWLTWPKNALSSPPLTCDSAGGTGTCDGGWDKSSDINIQVFASQVATSISDCKSGNWMNLVTSNGTSFKNQGDCVSYVASQGKANGNP